MKLLITRPPATGFKLIRRPWKPNYSLGKTCTTVDHIYPAPPDRSMPRGTKCYCGKQSWGEVN